MGLQSDIENTRLIISIIYVSSALSITLVDAAAGVLVGEREGLRETAFWVLLEVGCPSVPSVRCFRGDHSSPCPDRDTSLVLCGVRDLLGTGSTTNWPLDVTVPVSSRATRKAPTSQSRQRPPASSPTEVLVQVQTPGPRLQPTEWAS